MTPIQVEVRELPARFAELLACAPWLPWSSHYCGSVVGGMMSLRQLDGREIGWEMQKRANRDPVALR
jgi:hypothetical protein